MAGNGWYYVDNETRVGPVERSEMQRLISQGVIDGQTMVWRDGMAGWEAASDHFEFAGGGSTPPPIMPSHSRHSSAAQAQVHSAAPGSLYSGAPARGFGEAISVCFSRYAGFSGRASRSEYWYFVLFNVIVGFLTGFIDAMAFGLENDLSPLNTVVSLVLFLPSIAAGWRRLHDTNRSGWWIGAFWLVAIVMAVIVGGIAMNDPYALDDMISLVSVAGIAVLIYSVVLLVFLCQRGDPGPNRFG